MGVALMLSFNLMASLLRWTGVSDATRSTPSCYLSSSGVNGSQIKIGEEPVLVKYALLAYFKQF